MSIYYDITIIPNIYTNGIINVLYYDDVACVLKGNIQEYIELRCVPADSTEISNNIILKFFNLFNDSKYNHKTGFHDYVVSVNRAEIKEELKNILYKNNKIDNLHSNLSESRILYFVDCFKYHIDKIQSK